MNDPAEAIKRRNTVLQRMAEVGDIPQQEADAAKEAPLGLKVSKPKNGCIAAVKGASFFCKYVERSSSPARSSARPARTGRRSGTRAA